MNKSKSLRELDFKKKSHCKKTVMLEPSCCSGHNTRSCLSLFTDADRHLVEMLTHLQVLEYLIWVGELKPKSVLWPYILLPIPFHTSFLGIIETS